MVPVARSEILTPGKCSTSVMTEIPDLPEDIVGQDQRPETEGDRLAQRPERHLTVNTLTHEGVRGRRRSLPCSRPGSRMAKGRERIIADSEKPTSAPRGLLLQCGMRPDTGEACCPTRPRINTRLAAEG